MEALRRLPLSAEDLQRMPLDRRIAANQEALGQFVPEAERAAVASQLFGDRAALVFTRIDTATLRQATADVHVFGVVASDQDAAQIERTNDAISRLGLIWRGVSNQLAVAAASALEAVAGSVRLALNGVEQMSGWSADTVTGSVTGSVTFTAAPANGIIITAGFEFDVPLRFDSDTLDVTLDFERLGTITSIPLLKIR